MENKSTDQAFWSEHYKEGNIPWDIGHVSTPIKEYFDQLENKNLRILIPGGGNSYEAEYLFRIGFQNVFVVDIAQQPLSSLKKRSPKFPQEQLLHQDFFTLNEKFDLIIEQTFFCALHPTQRKKYIEHCHHLLNQHGLIVGLLFNIPLHEDKPPYGGHKKEYDSLFNPFFKILIMEEAYNSIPPRSGNELFIKLEKK